MSEPSSPPASGPRAALRRLRRPWVTLAAAVVTLAVLAAGAAVALRPSPTALAVEGVAPGALVGPEDRAGLTLRVVPEGVAPSDVRVRLDGEPVDARTRDGALVVTPRDLPEGRHVLTARTTADGPFASPATSRRAFTVDTTPPRLRVDRSLTAPSLRDRVVVEGHAPVDARVAAVGAAEVSRDGRQFRAAYDTPPAEARLRATDAAGNTREARVRVTVRHPGMRGVHLTASAWASPALRRPVLRMAREGRIDTVEIDLKDEGGVVGHDSQVPLARRTGAAKGLYDARKAVQRLHGLGVRVVGRLVCFHDPVLAEWSWRNGHRERVIQERGGGAWSGGYGDYAFTSFADPAVRQYNIDLAVEAAELGFDDVLYDYVRRPDGDFSRMRVPGLQGSATDAITSFVAESRRAVRPKGAFLGASVFGVAASRPELVAQHVPSMARHADYIAPMVYPSHWGSGEYGVADPNRQPYAITRRSVADFRTAVKGTNARVIPWLQDFSLGVAYGPAEVRAQVRAAEDTGAAGFLLWNASARYHADALAPRGGV
jgi:hypothetical protein